MNVLIVGAGPAGSTAAYYLAKAGIDVTVLEKTSFPREKVCGDGLTPRAVREIQKLGLAHPETEGWRRNKGLRLIAGGRTIELPWPEVSDFPQYGLIRTRLGFDEELARHAESAGAVVLERHSVSEALRAEDGRVTGVRAALLDGSGRKTGETRDFTADVVLAADGNSTRTAVSLGIQKRDDRPLGVAVRTYFTVAPARGRLDGGLARASRPRRQTPARLRLGLRRRRRHLQRGPGHPELLEGLRQAGLQAGPARMDRRHARRLGLHPGEPGGRDPRRRAAHGLQPDPALLPGPAAARRCRRHGVPVQRRGHLLRHGVRPLRGGIHRRRRRPVRLGRLGVGTEASTPPTRTLRGTPTTCGSSGARTSRWAGRSPR